jgi:hypothetical protein
VKGREERFGVAIALTFIDVLRMQVYSDLRNSG